MMVDLITNLTWGVALLSVLGAILNAKARIAGFYIWIVANLLWVAFDVYIQSYAQAALFAVYTGICILGIYSWRKLRKGE